MINRGNYRGDVFGSVGAAQAFEQVLAEACEHFGWQLHAYVLMRNHFHLALETPEPNLVEGMHWLQSTYATRFNRFRGESGHLFQGRYQSLLIEDAAALVRVVDYIHLNPVRAGILPVDQVGAFRWSSLRQLRREDRLRWLVTKSWLTQLGLADDAPSWSGYIAHLQAKAADTDGKRDHEELCRGWAIGTAGWRAAVAKDHRHLSLHVGIAAHELRELKHARWEDALARALHDHGQSRESLTATPKGVAWKCEIAETLRREAGAPHAWIAEKLHMGSPNSVRALLCRRRKSRNQQSAA